MKLNRRTFLTGCSAAIAALAGGRVSGLSFANANSSTQPNMLVVVSLRGGCDGLNLVAPIDDPNYVAARNSELRVSTQGLQLANPLDGLDFRLHPAARGLHELYGSNALAIVHACGLTNGTRSHFEAIEYMERGTPTERRTASGWLTRYLAQQGAASGLLPAVATTASLPIALNSSSQAVAVPQIGEFGLWSEEGEVRKRHEAALQQLYQGEHPLHRAGARTLNAVQTLAANVPRNEWGEPLPYEAEGAIEYPADGNAEELSVALQTVAQLIKLDMGLQVATVDYGGWDTHEQQAEFFPYLVEGLAQALHAFYNDLARYHNRLTVVVLSEFGRRLHANASSGTDHGYGNVLLVLGGKVNGGQMYGTWPGLATEQLDDGADLAITTDYRTVLSEVLAQHMAAANVQQVFPGLATYQLPGLMRA